MQEFIQLVIDGLASGSIYASLALALVLVNRSTGIINFAQGAMAVISTYLALTLLQLGAPSPLALLSVLMASFLLGAVLEHVVIRRFEVRNSQIAVVVSIALFLLLTGLAGLIWGYSIQQFPSFFPNTTVEILGASVSAQSLGTSAVVVVIVVLLQLLFRGTKLGLALRAVAINQESSALSAIPVARLLMVGWGLAAVLGAVSGVLVAPKLYLQPSMMDTVLVYALAAAVMGGLDSPIGAVVAAWFIGVSENLASAYVPFIGDDLKIVVPLAAMLTVLLLRPQGLFGHKEVVRV